MRRILCAVLMTVAIACGGDATAPTKTPPKPDPYITIRLLNHLDTTTKAGRANWRVYALLSGPQENQNGIAFQGTFTLSDARIGSRLMCMSIGADSVGQRLVAPFAIGDTVNAAFQPPSATDSIVARWYAGNHAAASGYVILSIDPTDAWNSQQYLAGHGLVPADPIKWAWDWTVGGTTTFTERVATDTTACNKF